jgi:hypothetical protein
MEVYVIGYGIPVVYFPVGCMTGIGIPSCFSIYSFLTAT